MTVISNNKLIGVDALILCGGYGTRFQSVSTNTPKGLALVNGRPFLDILIDELKSNGIKRFIFAVSHLRSQIIEHFKNRSDIDVAFSIEEVPLGTGGAIKYAQKLIQSNPFLVLNGDSACQINLSQFLRFHNNNDAILSIVLSRAESTCDYGNVTLDSSSRIVGFKEKVQNPSEGLISAGIYFMNKTIFSEMPDEESFSIEIDFFQKQVLKLGMYGLISDNVLIDIGTAERYELANKTTIF